MRLLGLLLTCLAATTGAQSGQVLFEGARLLVGDGSDPVENSAFVVEGDRIIPVGRQGEFAAAPAGAARVDLTGKTVMPALVSTHVHVGLLNGMSFTPDNYTRDMLIDHLKRYAYYGVGTVLTAGTDVACYRFRSAESARRVRRGS